MANYDAYFVGVIADSEGRKQPKAHAVAWYDLDYAGNRTTCGRLLHWATNSPEITCKCCLKLLADREKE